MLNYAENIEDNVNNNDNNAEKSSDTPDTLKDYLKISNDLHDAVMKSETHKEREEVLRRADAYISAVNMITTKRTAFHALDIGRLLDDIFRKSPSSLSFRAAFANWQTRGYFRGIGYKSASEQRRLWLHPRLKDELFLEHVQLSALYWLSGANGTDRVIDKVEKAIRSDNTGTRILTLAEVQQIAAKCGPAEEPKRRRAHPPRLDRMAEEATAMTGENGRFLRTTTKADIRQTLQALALHIEAGDQEALEIIRTFAARPGIQQALAQGA